MTIRTPADIEQNPNLVIFTGGVYNITVAFENQETEQSAVDGTIHRQVNYTRAVLQFGVRREGFRADLMQASPLMNFTLTSQESQRFALPTQFEAAGRITGADRHFYQLEFNTNPITIGGL